jgi:ADP-heptose:LPS heptosyltransferase
MKKILILRFSSIGDIVLTTPVIRCLKQQLPGAEIHYATKSQFSGILEPNPFIDKVYSFKKEVNEILPALKQERYDFIVDLHKNLRSWRVLLALRRPCSSFSKLNARKFLLTKFKINTLPDIHIVDRYFHAVKKLGVVNDGKGLDYFIKAEDEYPLSNLPETHQNGYVALVIGAKHATKQLPLEKLTEICQKIKSPLILLGGKEDLVLAEQIMQTVHNSEIQQSQNQSAIINMCGVLSLAQSASLVRQSALVITHDTGLMHIAAAFHKPILSVWGNTVPEFGMYPYFPEGMANGSKIMEVKGLSCRPCSKIGYNACPKGHFRCMTDQQAEDMLDWLSK